MSQPASSVRIRGVEFPKGIDSPEKVDLLGGMLNPLLRQFAEMGANGTNTVANLDAQVVDFNVTTPSTDWTALTLAAGATNAGGAYASLGYRVTASGAQLQGRLLTLPALATTFATLPAAVAPAKNHVVSVDANAAYGQIEIGSDGTIKQNVGSLARLDCVAAWAPIAGAIAPLSCWPQRIRVSDSRKPLAVFTLSCRDSGTTPPSFSVGQPQWSYLGTSPGKPNLLSIDNLPGLALGRTYAMSVLVLFE